MRLDADTLDHLHGRRFSSAWRMPLGANGAAPQRRAALAQAARASRVLHVGCCDHLPLVAEKRALGLYLHQTLCQAAQHCVGVDINAEGVQQLRQMGYAEVYLPDAVPAQAFDVCIAADVIEHVGNPVDFLRSLRRYRFDTLVLATPNAFRWRNCLGRHELINSDHRFWFTPYTLCKVLVDAGYTPLQVQLCHGDSVRWQGRLAARLLGHVARWREALIVQARP